MALTKITGQVINDTTGLVVGVTTVGGGVSAVDGFFSGILTATGDASFSGNVSVAGTLTYEDVTNIDEVGIITARSNILDGSALTGIEVGLSTASSQVSGITTVIDLSKDDIRLDCTGLVTVDAKGGTEGGSHSLRIVNSGIATVTFNSYFKFPSGGAPNLPTASGAISLISFTVHTQGRVGVASVFLAGSSVNFI